MERLTAVAGAIRADFGVEFQTVPVDLLDSDSVDRLARRTAVVLTTAGPYSLYGGELVAACAALGTHYVDLAGEVPWIRQMIQRHEALARETGACIVHCAGFDSVPSDTGTLLLRETMDEAGLGHPDAVRMVIGRTNGGFSGGTAASLLAVVHGALRDPEVRQTLADRDSLVVGAPCTDGMHERLARSEGRAVDRRSSLGFLRFDRALRSWTLPFFMGVVNTRVVRRSNALAGYPLGADPDYRECIAFGRGPLAFCTAGVVAAAAALLMLILVVPPTRWLLSRFVLPKPGHGPKVAERGEGSFELTVRGYRASTSETAEFHGRELERLSETARVEVSSDRDPGYGATAIMIAECAILLARNRPPAGFHTPASACGRALADVLTDAGVRFEAKIL